MKINYKKNQKGFIALFSVIIITSVLLLVASTLSFTGFMGRLNVYDNELKKRSDALAEACIDVALLKIAQDPTYTTNEECVEIEDDCPDEESICTIISIENSGGNKLIQVEGIAGTSQRAFTFYEAEADGDTLELNYFRELEGRP